jgi:MoCo/4Fe-4S cofactor protein with predicted Tat translocation signal
MKTDLARFYAKLDGQNGPQFWRSLEELGQSPEFRACLEREFPAGASEWDEAETQGGMGRRQFLTLMGASLALAGLSGCSPRSREKIVPYVDQPEQIIPGQPLYYATAMPLNGYGRGILVETQMGRPVKIEGNPAHPDSLGATDAVTQAAILGLWDPDRSRTPYFGGQMSTWNHFQSELLDVLTKMRATQGEGLAVLTEPTSSPTLARQLEEFLAKFPHARSYAWSPAAKEVVNPLARRLPPTYFSPETDFGGVDLIVSVGSDFLVNYPGSLRYTRQFAARRRVKNGQAQPNRLYVLESAPTLTGAMADHRLSAPPDRIAAVLRRLGGAADEKLGVREETFARQLAVDLVKHAASAVVLAGDTEPLQIQELAHGLVGQAKPGFQLADGLVSLTDDLAAGRIKNLIILGGNPVHTAPADVRFGDALAKASFSAHLSLYHDETSHRCRWHLPEAHFLEAWSDIVASDATATIMQPAIEPLYAGKSGHEVMAMLGEDFPGAGYEIIRATWRQGRADGFENFWQQSVHDGFVMKDASTVRIAIKIIATPEPVPHQAFAVADYLLIRPDPTVGDGRWANNGWLQELPKPFTKLTWDNAALIGPAMAARHGLKTGDMVELRVEDRAVEAPIMILPGQADRCVTVHLGYGRTHGGHVAIGRGFNAYKLQTTANRWCAPGLQIRKLGRTYEFATTQTHFNMEGRDLVRVADLDEFRANPYFAQPELQNRPSLLPAQAPLASKTYAWGLAIDLSTCTGCNACVTACQAENNSPVVGKDQVTRGREMHWIRIDTYFEGPPDDPKMLHQPVMCMHCEKAPCEIVCPVAATVHNSEGLNTMVYNRCVGTRFCSNNCPYKVRRFNFLEYSAPADSAEAQGHNPNVTVRRRGVMEKCTYCVQRINEVRIGAELANRPIRDGEIKTACQQACPAEAIVFGNLLDPTSLVSRRKREPVNYGLLEELNTQPRTTYLARIRNPATLPKEGA